MPNILYDPSKRGAIMAGIRSKNTKAELIVFAELKKRGVTFRRHYEKVIGKPDIAKPRKKLAVFVDGDFWHGRELDRLISKYGEESFWVLKLRRNIRRDAEQAEALEADGWRVLRVWESDVKRLRTRSELMDTVVAFLRSRD